KRMDHPGGRDGGDRRGGARWAHLRGEAQPSAPGRAGSPQTRSTATTDGLSAGDQWRRLPSHRAGAWQRGRLVSADRYRRKQAPIAELETMTRWSLVLWLSLARGALASAQDKKPDDPFAKVLFPPEVVLKYATEIGLKPQQRQVIIDAIKKVQADLVGM